jgi:hypothetical protein
MPRQLRTRLLLLFTALLALTAHGGAWAHAVGEHYVWLKVDSDRLELSVEIHARDLAELLELDVDPEVPVNDDILAPLRDTLSAYIREHLAFSDANGPLPLRYKGIKPRNLGEGNYVMVDFEAGGDRQLGRVLTIRDDVLVNEDLQHRGLLMLLEDRVAGTSYRERTALIFSSFNSEQELDLDNLPRMMSRLQFIWQGMLHIFIGIDHVLFLVCLLLTAVLVRKNDGWVPAESFGQAMWKVVAIVTLFTIAHSITLFLAGLGYVRLPSRLVESIIALSIIFVAVNNLIGRFDSKKSWIILVFGLFHGLGFASVMAELPFRMLNLKWVVLFFNIGVELGQVAIVALVFPVLYALRGTRIYQPVVLVGGSVLIGLISTWWLAQRALGLG